MIFRAIARLNAMGALFGAWVLLLICCLSVPTKSYTFSTTTFGNGAVLELGMFGSCYTFNGVRDCTKTNVGYHLNVTQLPQYSANPGALVNVTEAPLTAALIFFPLAVGSISLANLLALVPLRMVTILALGMNFLGIGAAAISFGLSLIIFIRANAVLKLSFNPSTFVDPVLGTCMWFTAAALVSSVGGFLFLLLALEPAKLKAVVDDFGTTVYGASYAAALPAADNRLRELEREKSRSGSSHGAVAGKRDRNIDSDRMSSYSASRSNRNSHRSARSEYDDEEEEVRRPSKASRPASRSSRRYQENAEDESEEEEVAPRRKKSSRSRKSARNADDEVDFAGRSV
ncbi:hypothetical protein RQP46_000860 [Phenoliferia psychrophenolica]